MHPTPPISKSRSSWDILSQTVPGASRTVFPLPSMFNVQRPMFLPLFLTAGQLTAAPEPSKPGFIVKPSQITAARTYLQDGRTLTLG